MNELENEKIDWLDVLASVTGNFFIGTFICLILNQAFFKFDVNSWTITVMGLSSGLFLYFVSKRSKLVYVTILGINILIAVIKFSI